MEIRKHFEYNPILDLTVAQIGINKWNWTSIENEDEVLAKEIMKKNKFDVLPITESDGKTNKYYSTRTWGDYNQLNLNKIEKTKTIYYRTSLADLIQKFNEEEEHYFFLANNKDVLGLVSFVNLNCFAVYNYLFQIIADIEQSVAVKLKEHINEDEIIKSFSESQDSHLLNIISEFQNSRKHNVDSNIFEHMYLQTIGITINKFLNHLPKNLKSLNKFSKKFSPEGTYGEVRNKVMHPVRPILSDRTSIGKINELLSDYHIIKETLNIKP
ncbi:hypothetical protein CLV31_103199 [Algoriphagus aquaeductus]|uniref:Uncharacterized protein n=1 Tax=Algoriphagus aquaeductus TaxID=475299 RepID=A0A326RXC1_9BACT|nr:hypothetical protein [Algoriphagus aquaeductus]PZV85407.1 hypothetical protein CLV31_103199 [Algoriphagus aquaeductus]